MFARMVLPSLGGSPAVWNTALVEPFLRLAEQSKLWQGIYFIFLALFAICGFWLWRSQSPSTARQFARSLSPHPYPLPWGEGEAGLAQRAIPPIRRCRWILLAFIPSSLMQGVTAHLSTELAPVPLLWVIPLAEV